MKVVDLAGHNYIEKSRKYLEIVANVDIDDNGSEWKRITEIKKIRNCIAHNASSIKKGNMAQIKNHELFSVLANDKRIEFDQYSGDFYIKDKAYLLEVIELIKNTFLKSLKN